MLQEQNLPEKNQTSQDCGPLPGKALTSKTLFQIQNKTNVQIMKFTTSHNRA